jgi:inorganic triphosphatase YgiF
MAPDQTSENGAPELEDRATLPPADLPRQVSEALPPAREPCAGPRQSAFDVPSAPTRKPSPVRRPNGVARPSSGETELNLTVDADGLATLIDSPPIATHAAKKAAVRVFKDTYYDTAGGALKRAGVTLRVREFRKRFVQLVKVAPSEPRALVRGQQWAFPVSDNAPDFQPMMPLMAMGLQDVLDREALRPIFATEVRRSVQRLSLPTGIAEVAFDSGIVRAGDRTAPICEIKLKRADAAALYNLALELAEHATVRPAICSAAERGLELALQTAPAVHRQSRLLTDGDVSVDDAFRQLFQSALTQLVLNQPAAEDGQDREGVHQVRIALRRLRCALRMLRSLAPSATLDALRADAKWFASSLNAARNWDVFLGQTLEEVTQACGTVADFDHLREVAEQARSNGYAVARAALADRRTGRFELALGAWIEQRGWRCDVSGEHLTELSAPAIAFATRTLAKQHDRVLKRGRRFKRLPLEARHALRLEVKKLRYAVDFFLPLFGDDGTAKRYARQLSRLQERLGRYNDVAMVRQLMGEIDSEELPTAARVAYGAVLGFQVCRLATAETETRAAWRDFRNAPLPWAG